MVIYSGLFLPTRVNALCVWPIIFMRKVDAPLLAHEMVHYREQAWVTPFWFIRYWFSADFRVAAEVRAHKVQMQAGLSLFQAANWLVRYDKRLTLAGAYLLLAA